MQELAGVGLCTTGQVQGGWRTRLHVKHLHRQLGQYGMSFIWS